MTESRFERWGLVSLLLVCLLPGVPVAIGQLSGALVTIGPGWVWWACYLALFGLLMVAFVNARPAREHPHALLAVIALLGAAIVLLVPRANWTSILLVFIAALAAHLASTMVTGALLVANSAVVATVVAMAGGDFADIALGALIYAVLQACAVLAVLSQRRETEARERLTVANTELRGATALLAESSRAGERLRIARELHDLLGHRLTALVLELEVAAHRSTPPAAEHVERARGLAKDLLGDVRTAVGELRVRTPDLHQALADITSGLPRPRVHLTVDASARPDEAAVAALIRCVQEVVTNAIRHSTAENLWIDLGRGPSGEITLTARDDGGGASILRLGNGLTGVRERITQLGGTVAFETRSGFAVTATVPAP